MRPAALKILAALEHEDMTAEELVLRTKLSHSTIDKTLCPLHNDEQVHILDWPIDSKGRHAARWRLGPGDDADRVIGRGYQRVDAVAALLPSYRADAANPFRISMWNVAPGIGRAGMTPVTIDLFWIIMLPAIGLFIGFCTGLMVEIRK